MTRLETMGNIFCALMALVALGVAGWTIVTGQIGEQGLDALFLLAVCLTIALVFAMIPLQSMRRRTGVQSPKKQEGGADATDKS
jgi:hypothetical protein